MGETLYFKVHSYAVFVLSNECEFKICSSGLSCNIIQKNGFITISLLSFTLKKGKITSLQNNKKKREEKRRKAIEKKKLHYSPNTSWVRLR